MKVDYVELSKQMREEAIKAGEYMKVEVFIPSLKDKLGDFLMEGKPIVPFGELDVKKTGPVEAVFLLNALKGIEEQIKKKYPEVELVKSLIELGGGISTRTIFAKAEKKESEE